MIALAIAAAALLGAAEESPAVERQVKVYYEPGRFGGWPANHGMWIWDNEILVGLSRGFHKDLGTRHNIDRDKPEEHLLARSFDGGETWTLEFPQEKGQLVPQGASLHGTEIPGLAIPEWTDCPGGIDFTNPGFAMTLRMTDVDVGPSRFFYTYDRGKNWQGPFKFPNLDTSGVAARTDYIVDGKHEMLTFQTAGKSDTSEGRCFVARTTDGAKTWEFVSFIGPEPVGFEIMPASVRISDSELYVVVRRREDTHRSNAAYRSLDNGATWTYEGEPVPNVGEGNPPSLLKLQDGRIALIYGVRAEPFRMGAKLSRDGGRTWTDEIVLRGDGSTRDMGYPRSVQRPDGKVVSTYYFTDLATGPERYIGATIWDPSKID
jgi:hypothetical protein